MLTIKLYGALKDQMPAKYKGKIQLHAHSMQEALEALNQIMPFAELLNQFPAEFRYGKSLKTSNPMPVELVARGLVDSNMTIHIVPGTGSGDEITTAMIVTALVSAAVSIGITLLMSLLFPPEQDGKDSRKSKLYENGLNTQKEGVSMGYIAGEEVFCGGNVIEADVDVVATGGLGSSFEPGPNYQGGLNVSGPRSAADLLKDALQGKFGGGGGKTRANNVFSDATLKILMCPGVGPIGGLVGSSLQEKQSNIMIDGIALTDMTTGQNNWTGFAYEERTGTPDQTACAITPDISNTINEGVEIKYANTAGAQLKFPYPTKGENVNRIKINVNLVLVKTDKKGNQQNTSVTLGVDTRRTDGTWGWYGNFTFPGKSSEPFQRQLMVMAPPTDPANPDAGWDFRIYRVTPDSDDDKLQNQTTLKGWVEIQDKELTYAGRAGIPDAALFACSIDLSQFDATSPPEIGLLLAGTIVRVPDNYVNGHLPANAGEWTGGWSYQVTSNPVWHWFNLATNPVYGAGIPESFFNRYSLYQVAAYCDTMIDQTIGGVKSKRRRFTINKQFTDDVDAWQALREIAQSFRAVPYWDGSAIVLVQERPMATSEQAQTNVFINNSQVQDGLFLYKPTEPTSRVNVIRVEYDNPDDKFKKGTVELRDDASIARNLKLGLANGGRVESTVYKTGCTSKAEATDFARMLLWTGQNEVFTSTFNVSLVGAKFRPGDIIGIVDYNVNGLPPIGRLKSVNASSITWDAPYNFVQGRNYTVLFTKTDGSSGQLTFAAQVTNSVASLNTSGSNALEGTPVYIMDRSASGVKPTYWQVVGITESDMGMFEVTAQQYIYGKFDYYATGIDVIPDKWTEKELNVPAPETLTARSYSYQDDLLGTVHAIDLNWSPVNAENMLLQGYLLEASAPGTGTWSELYQGTNTAFTLKGAEMGTYIFTIKSINTLGKTSDPTRLVYNFTTGMGAQLLPPIILGADDI